jgi:hypothetical protein
VPCTAQLHRYTVHIEQLTDSKRQLLLFTANTQYGSLITNFMHNSFIL